MRYLPYHQSTARSRISPLLISAISLSLLGPTVADGASSLPSSIPTSVPVTVTNTPLPVTAPSPLPVSGNVNITNAALPVTGTVSASQAGPWTVGITGTPAVTLASPITVAADDAAKTAFQAALGFSGCHTVPDGKRAVIEFASANGTVQYDFTQRLALIAVVGLYTNVGGAGVLHTLTLARAGIFAGFEAVAGATSTRLYADATTTICAQAINTNFLSLAVTISGHYVTMP
jgi:hypothetical protein